MSPTDLPPVTTPHAAKIIRDNYPATSETATVASVIQLFQHAAESAGTADTAEMMFALIEANATGKAPDALLNGFTEDQRCAFDRAWHQLNMGQGASVMAQDILNTKVALNGTVMEFESAVEQLIASYAGSGGPSAPKNQAEFERTYNELLDQAKKQADTLGKNHKSTQDQLVAGVQKGAVPSIPSTMAPTSPSNPTVPGMPDNALGSMLQSVAGVMSKPPNLPLPNIGQSAQPVAQSAQQAISELMNSVQPGGVPVSDDALTKLTTASGLTGQSATLSGPRTPHHGAHAAPLSGGGGVNARTTLAGSSGGELKPRTAPESTTPVTAASTDAPTPGGVGTTLASGEAVTGPDTLSSPHTHVSSGDAASGAPPLSTSTPGASPAGMGVPMIGPVMGPMKGSAPPGGPSGGAPAAASAPPPGDAPKPGRHQDLSASAGELADFGAEHRGLPHATDLQHVAAEVAAAMVRQHDRTGVRQPVAVGLSGLRAVVATADGLGFLWPGVKAPANLMPLITAVPDRFVQRWMGCAHPWRPLIAAAEAGLIAPLDAVVSTDPSAAQDGVLVVSPAEIDDVNAAPATRDRHTFDAVDIEDVDAAFEHLSGVWGRLGDSPDTLAAALSQLRWTSPDGGRDRYIAAWMQYLCAAALADLRSGDIDSARYVLRNALRVPVHVQAGRP
jgi:hypothetical protein